MAHSQFVDAVQRQCLLAPDKTWKLIEGVVVQILNQVLQFADLQQKLRKPVSPCQGLACERSILPVIIAVSICLGYQRVHMQTGCNFRCQLGAWTAKLA